MVNIFIESGFSISLFVNAVLFIPQIIRIHTTKDAKEVSFITFFGFWLIQLFTVLHAFIRKDYILMFGYVFSMITCGYIVGLIVYYRIKKWMQN